MYTQFQPSNSSNIIGKADDQLEGEASPPLYTEADAEELLGQYPPPPPNCQPLSLPVCLPQITSGYDSPFARAYNPELANSGINEEDWLKFLDGLNIAITASPPLRVVDLAGMVIGFVPYHWAIIAGAAMQTAAQTAMHVLSKTLTDRYLRKANSEYFEPRGLKVRLMKTEAMRKFVHMDAAASAEPSKVKAFAKAAGRTAETVALHLPIPFLGRIMSMIPNSAPKIDADATDDMTHRRLGQLAGYVMPVTTDVPPAQTPESLLDKTSALAIKLRQWKGRKSETKAMRSRKLLAIAEGRAPMSELYQMEGRQARKAMRRERRGRYNGKYVRKLRGKVAKADRLEYLSTYALVWVVLINADQDREIEGTEIVDSRADAEEVNNDEWEDQLEHEDEEDIEEAKVVSEVKMGPSTRLPYAYPE